MGRIRAWWVVLALASAACGGGGGDVVDPPAAVASVTVTLAAPQIFIGQTSQATAVLRDAQNNTLTGRPVTWSSSNTAVATVSAATGLVTGVAAGTSSISATSEGKTGQADITVTVDPATQPQIQNVTATQNGQPANLAQVAGTLRLAFSVQVPAGYTGTLTVKVDTVEFLRETVTAPPLAARLTSGAGAAPAAPAVVTVERTVDIESSRTTTLVGSDEISELPLIGNGARIAQLLVTPGIAGGPTAQQNVNFTANNPPHAHGLFRFSGQTAAGSDGRTYTGGVGQGAVVFATYGNEVINGFEVTLTDLSPLYGRGTGGVINVIQKIPRTNRKFFDISAVPTERPNLTFVLSRVTINGQDINPQVDYFGNTAFTTDLIGSGFANTPQQVTGLVAPAGKSFVQVHQLPVDLFNTAAVHGRATLEPFHLDNLGPRQSSAVNEPVFAFLDRKTTVGGEAFWTDFGYGAFSNQVSARYEFTGGFRPDRLTDITGVDPSRTRFYAGPIADIANLYTPQYLVGDPFSLNESSGSRLYTAGALVFDRRGNSSGWPIVTTVANPWNILGQQSTGGQIGVQQGAFGFTAQRATLNITGIPDESTWNSSSLDPAIGWTWSASASLVGIPDGWLSARGKLNGTFGFGTGPAKDGFQVLSSTGGATGGTATVTAKSIVDAFGSMGPVPQGLYEFDFKAADNAGRYIGDMMYPRRRALLVDYTGPTNPAIAFDGPVTPGALSSGSITGNDPYGIRTAYVGFRFDYASGLFAGLKAYVPAGVIGVPGTFGGPIIRDLSMPLSGIPPVGFWFFNPFSGVVDWGNFYRSDAAVLQLRDYAWNLSPLHFAPFTNMAPVPALTNVFDVRASLGTSNWCPGTCPLGGSRLVDLNFDFFDDRSMGDPMISKAQWFGIPSGGGGIVYPLGLSTQYTAVPEGPGRRISYDFTIDLGDYCGPSGSMLVFPIGYARDFKSFIKAGSFFSATVRAPTRYTNNCNVPPPPPPPPPPAF